jgi:hypothetical protein
MKLSGLFKTKALLTIVAGILLVGGATVAAAATATGQHVAQSTTHAHATKRSVATHQAGQHGQKTGRADQQQSDCPGQVEADTLATKYHLGSTAVQAICALHEGTFTGTTSSGVSGAARRVYGYGEIQQLLTYAAYLASHDKANAGGKLTDSNVSSYLAAALHSCGTSALATCLKTNIPAEQPGTGGHGNGNGKGNKPTVKPTPHMPAVTPTPHH